MEPQAAEQNGIDAKLATLAAENIATTNILREFIVSQGAINKGFTDAITAAAGATGRVWSLMAPIIVAAFVGMYLFVMSNVNGLVGPVKDNNDRLSQATSGIQTSIVELAQKNIEFSTQVNCLEIVREYENSVQEMLRTLEAEDALKLPPGQVMPQLSYHPFCQPVVTSR
jgi:hypothetical protein